MLECVLLDSRELVQVRGFARSVAHLCRHLDARVEQRGSRLDIAIAAPFHSLTYSKYSHLSIEPELVSQPCCQLVIKVEIAWSDIRRGIRQSTESHIDALRSHVNIKIASMLHHSEGLAINS